MNYIDGFVAAVPNANKAAYLEHARVASRVFKEYGAIKLVECWGDDIPEGEVTSFPMAVQCNKDETVVFFWIEWPSKAVRDQSMKKLMQDDRINPEINPMPFDGMRMIYGGFQMILDQ